MTNDELQNEGEIVIYQPDESVETDNLWHFRKGLTND